MAERDQAQRVRVRVAGVVQGVGFRPFVRALALQYGLTGFVSNDSAGVLLEAQGSSASIDALLSALATGPAMAVVDRVEATELPLVDESGFSVLVSQQSAGSTSIPPDLAVCEDCLREMRNPSDRRFGYAFIACTNCGPRYTIVTGLPYDRPFTTMADFPLCPECAREYAEPASRRFHAQPTACPDCGPRLSMPISEIVEALSAGAIVALKGIGGYHLACDARNSEAVSLLRARKHRGDKPFALMVANVSVADDLVLLNADSLSALRSPARPVVLAPSVDSALQRSIAPGNGYLGVMLPYAPLHHLLFDAGCPDVLVMTSGNLADEPICTTQKEAQDRLGELADVLVHHDRRIHVACDDSVVRAAEGMLQPVRRSRGYAPLPITLPFEIDHLIAVGGELKTTICVSRENHAWMSQHIGDTENLETLAMLARTVETLSALQRLDPVAIVSDLHPAYLSRRWAKDEADRRGIDHLLVQHHHAHLAGLLAEHQWPMDSPVIGFAFDGTGFGLDGTIWGGEILLGGYAAVQRKGHLASILLPGGDAAVRRPLRTALAHAAAAGISLDDSISTIRDAEPGEAAIIERMLATSAGCTPTTSMGRLFDAVASILDVRQSVDYEGQAAIELEALAATVSAGPDPVPSLGLYRDEQGLILDPGPLVASAVASVRAGIPRARAARDFHTGVATGVMAAARELRDQTGVGVVGLTGGVFANSVLTQECRSGLVREGFTVLIHRLVPPNDGGLALGQVVVAAAGGAQTG